MSNKKSFSARIDGELYDRIAEHCKQQDISQAQFLEALAREFFDIPGEASDSITRNEFESKLDSAIQGLRDELLGKFAA